MGCQEAEAPEPLAPAEQGAPDQAEEPAGSAAPDEAPPLDLSMLELALALKPQLKIASQRPSSKEGREPAGRPGSRRHAARDAFGRGTEGFAAPLVWSR